VHERLIGEDVEVRLVLDRTARRERDRRRRGGEQGREGLRCVESRVA
jgi:hypothetical protein